jgi:exodeoxyribonuclease VIII
MNIINYKDFTPEQAEKGCFVIGMPDDAYHSHDSVSKSMLDLVNRSPAHLAYAQEKDQTRGMVIGSAIHCAILEPLRFDKEYMILKGVTKRTESTYKQAIKQRDEALTLTEAEGDNVLGMQEAMQLNPTAIKELKKDGYAELSAFVTCPVTGLLLRCRYDWVTLYDNNCIDLKKTQDVRYEAFQKSVANYRYHVQDAFYSYVYKLITGNKLRFRFLTVEEQQPHANKVFELDTEAKQVGARQFKADLEAYKHAMESGDWSGIAQEDEMLNLPMWALDDEAEVEL